MLKLDEIYFIEKFKMKHFWKANPERGQKMGIKSATKSGGKILGKFLSGDYSSKKEADKDIIAADKKARIADKIGTHGHQVVGAVGLAGAAYLAYKLHKKYKAKASTAKTQEEKAKYTDKANQAKAKAQKLKAKGK